MGFFDFATDLPFYEGRANSVGRLNARHHFLIAPYADQIKGARVLDLGAHDGRWSYAFAAAGAREVVGIEARQGLIDLFASYPDPAIRARVELRCDDLWRAVEAAVNAGERYDIIAVFGVFYHIMDHFRLLDLLRQICDGFMIIDTELADRRGPVITLSKERTDKDLNAAPQIRGQQVAVKGIPSKRAVALMAEALDLAIYWSDWSTLPPEQRQGVGDYFKTEGTYRATCTLFPD